MICAGDAVRLTINRQDEVYAGLRRLYEFGLALVKEKSCQLKFSDCVMSMKAWERRHLSK